MDIFKIMCSENKANNFMYRQTFIQNHQSPLNGLQKILRGRGVRNPFGLPPSDVDG